MHFDRAQQLGLNNRSSPFKYSESFPCRAVAHVQSTSSLDWQPKEASQYALPGTARPGRAGPSGDEGRKGFGGKAAESRQKRAGAPSEAGFSRRLCAYSPPLSAVPPFTHTLSCTHGGAACSGARMWWVLQPVLSGRFGIRHGPARAVELI